MPLSLAIYLIANKCVSAFAKGPSAKQIADHIIASLASGCAPEPREQLGFVLALILPVALAFAVTMLLRRLGVFARQERPNPWVSALALLSQLVVFAVAARALVFQATTAYRYRFLEDIPLVAAGLIVGAGIASASHLPGEFPRIRALCIWLQRLRWLPWLLALAWVVVHGLTGIFRQMELASASPTVKANFPFIMGEYAAVLDGRTPLVNFFPQYQNLQGLVLAPVFKIVGFGVGSFTTVMFCETVAAFALLFFALKKISQSAWTALLLFIPMVAMAFYSNELLANGYRTHSFNYYPVGPVRYFGTCLMALLSLWYLERPKLSRLIVCAVAATLVALNNLDFGVTAAAGMLACTLLFPPRFAAAGLVRRIIVAATLFGLSALTALGVYCLFLRVFAGGWPMLGQVIAYQKTFALLGFYMIPMPKLGLHWVVYLTLISAVVLVIFETFSVDHDTITDHRRLINGSLAYSGIAGFGPLAYYVGRSHPMVLVATFLAWTYVLVQLAHRAWQQWRETAGQPRRPGDFLLCIPTVAIFGLYVLTWSAVFEVPNPVQELRRIFKQLPSAAGQDVALTKLINKYVPEGGKTAIVYRDAHWLALQAHVSNVFPFAHFGSLILKEQVNATMAALTQMPPKRQFVFGSPVPELRVLLEQSGYKQVEAIGDFAVWSKSPD